MAVPANAKPVFKGVIWDVYQWEQEMFDGSKRTFEMVSRNGTAEVIAVVDGKIVIAEEEQPGHKFKGIVAGRLEQNEDALQGAKRELLEETGLASDDWELLFHHEGSRIFHWPTHVYVARACRQVQHPEPDEGEKIQLHYVTFEEFLELINTRQLRGRDLQVELLYLQRDPVKLEEFRKKLLR